MVRGVHHPWLFVRISYLSTDPDSDSTYINVVEDPKKKRGTSHNRFCKNFDFSTDSKKRLGKRLNVPKSLRLQDGQKISRFSLAPFDVFN